MEEIKENSINSGGRPHVVILKDGPIMIEGLIKIIQDDDIVMESKKCFLCRCGGSSNKPYCDGTHKKIDFKS